MVPAGYALWCGVNRKADGARALLDNRAAQQVWGWLARRYRERRLTLETSPQLDLGIDSLEWLALSLKIGQRTGVELSEEAISSIDTVRDLLQAVAEASEQGTAAHRVDPLETPEAALSDRQEKWLEPLGPVRSALSSALLSFSRFLMHRLFRLRVQGLEHLPTEGPFVLTPNHVSYLDPFAIGAALSNHQLHDTYWAGWTGVAFRNALIRFFSRLGQAVPIDPDHAVMSSLAFGASVLKRGKKLVWFPEGARSLNGKLQPFKPGLGLLLEHFPVPVIPVFIHGSHEALPVGKFLQRFAQITVVFGAPVSPRDLRERGKGREAHDRIVDALHDTVATLADRP